MEGNLLPPQRKEPPSLGLLPTLTPRGAYSSPLAILPGGQGYCSLGVRTWSLSHQLSACVSVCGWELGTGSLPWGLVTLGGTGWQGSRALHPGLPGLECKSRLNAAPRSLLGLLGLGSLPLPHAVPDGCPRGLYPLGSPAHRPHDSIFFPCHLSSVSTFFLILSPWFLSVLATPSLFLEQAGPFHRPGVYRGDAF